MQGSTRHNLDEGENVVTFRVTKVHWDGKDWDPFLLLYFTATGYTVESVSTQPRVALHCVTFDGPASLTSTIPSSSSSFGYSFPGWRTPRGHGIVIAHFVTRRDDCTPCRFTSSVQHAKTRQIR